jgi:hypothetical protein
VNKAEETISVHLPCTNEARDPRLHPSYFVASGFDAQMRSDGDEVRRCGNFVDRMRNRRMFQNTFVQRQWWRQRKETYLQGVRGLS